MDERTKRPLLEWSIATRPVAGEERNGDRALVRVLEDSALVAAVDGLGHGTGAADAAAPAVEILHRFAHEPLETLLGRCHEALRQTRGAAISAARFSAEDDTMTWLGVGNVEGRLVHPSASGTGPSDSLIAFGGTAGHRLPSLRTKTLPVHRGDTLVFTTDGIDSGFADSLRTAGTTDEIAASILREYAKDSDDALVVVARYLGRRDE